MIGALIFAYNNQVTDYIKLASWSANNIRRHLKIPVAIVTDQDPIDRNFDRVIKVPAPEASQRYFDDYSNSAIWYNSNRPSVFEITPWDKTLVLDADYVVASDCLSKLFNSNQDFLAHRWAFDISQQNGFLGLNYFGTHHMPQWWATVMYFNRNKVSEMIFKIMSMVRDNWAHYKHIYGIGRSVYRNDHALSIALNTINGHTLNVPCIPWSMASSMPGHKLQKINQDQYRVEFITSDQKRKIMTLYNQDFHAMGKQQLEVLIAS